jgi:neurotransmitter:Na+ symporter, NSS family
MPDPTGADKQAWGSRLGVILAVAGSAVGLGNFLRFPGQASQNGGGAFMIPYFLAFVLLGIPIGWAEWTMARYGGRKGFHSAPGVMGVIGRGPLFRYLGMLGVLIPLVVCMYYVLIESWCLYYAFRYLIGDMNLGSDPAGQVQASKAIFVGITGSDQDGVMMGGGLHVSVVFWLITMAVNLALVWRGLSKGIEKFCNIAMPLMAVCALVVLIRVMTLGTPDPAQPERSVLAGLGFMWNPDFSKLFDFKTWLAAAGQIFFSLSVGFGVIINYASYMKKKDDVALSGLTATATNELFEVGFGGLITLTAAFVFLGLTGTTAAVAGGTFGLGFNTLPVVFAQMGAVGPIIGTLWFFMLFLAAITSSISMYQPALAFFDESLGWTRERATGLLVVVCLIGSFFVMYFSRGSIFLNTIDSWVGTFLIFVLAMVQIIVFSWVFGFERGWNELHQGAHMQVPRVFRFIMKYVTPTYLLLVFIAFSFQNLPAWIGDVASQPLAQGALALIGAVLLLLLVCTRVGEKRWRAAGLDVDGASVVERTR